MSADKRITLAWSGASGAPYGLRLLECLLQTEHQVFLLISQAARQVLLLEEELPLPTQADACKAVLAKKVNAPLDNLVICGKNEWGSPVASGSAAPKKMVICPCSMGTVAAVAHGLSDDLLERAADVVLKERGKLVLVVRETPFSTLHLSNLLTLSQMGAIVMPAAPGFYHKPNCVDDLVDFMVARVLSHLDIDLSLVPRWGYTRDIDHNA
ncbi:MAG: flavin prenyltransferase UbiX [Vibrionaceae bacterium]